jgi:hypothetical protein
MLDITVRHYDEVLDPRLGRHVRHDPRSKNFPVRSIAPPRVRSIEHRRLVGAYDQGGYGSCTIQSTMGILSTRPFDHRFTSQRAFLRYYTELTQTDSIPGAMPAEDTGSTGLDAAKFAKRHGWIDGYRWCFGIDDVVAGLQIGSVSFGTDWYERMFTPTSDGFVEIGGALAGGHQYQCYGVDLERRVLKFWQSWGSRWGVQGRFQMTFDTAATLLAAHGDAILLQPAA